MSKQSNRLTTIQSLAKRGALPPASSRGVRVALGRLHGTSTVYVADAFPAFNPYQRARVPKPRRSRLVWDSWNLGTYRRGESNGMDAPQTINKTQIQRRTK